MRHETEREQENQSQSNNYNTVKRIPFKVWKYHIADQRDLGNQGLCAFAFPWPWTIWTWPSLPVDNLKEGGGWENLNTCTDRSQLCALKRPLVEYSLWWQG